MAKGIGGKASKVAIWILLALLIVGLAGFGIGSFGGSATAVGRVGDQEITAQSYFRALDQAIRARRAETGAPVSRAEAEAAGLLREVQGQLAGQAALNGEADELGLSVSDETVGEQVLNQPAFRGPSGEFDRQTYEFTLRQNGWTVPEFEEELRAETARALLQGAVASGVAAPDALVEVMTEYLGERRSFAWVRFGPADLDAPLPEPSQADLQAQYEDTPEAYTLPETRRITYALLTPEAMADTIAPQEGAVEALYQERIDAFRQPERRLVERLVFEDEAAARAAQARLEAGEVTFPELVAERDLSLSDIDMGDASRADLGAAAEDVFALEEPGVVGPLPSPLGPALYRVNAILNARETPLEEVREELAQELTVERARRQLEDLAGDLDDRLAAGATLEDLGAETEMEVGTVDYYPGIGPEEGGEIVGYAEFREAAQRVTQDDFPRIEFLEDGSLYALRLDEVVPPRVPPLADVRATVAADWRQAETRRRLAEQAEALRAELGPGAALADQEGAETAELVTRDTFIEGVPPTLIERAFALEPGARAVVEGQDAVFLLEVTEVAGPDEGDERLSTLRQALSAQAQQGLADDLLQLYGRALLRREGLSFDQPALNAVHTQVFN